MAAMRSEAQFLLCLSLCREMKFQICHFIFPWINQIGVNELNTLHQLESYFRFSTSAVIVDIDITIDFSVACHCTQWDLRLSEVGFDLFLLLITIRSDYNRFNKTFCDELSKS